VSPAPRIDTALNEIATAMSVLEQTARIMPTLHELAYDRHSAAEQIRVKAGKPEYYLDNHGDPRARAALRRISTAVIAATGKLTDAAKAAERIVGEGGDPGDDHQHPALVTIVEHAEALDAQLRRLRRGEFDPGATYTQKTHERTNRTMVRKIRSLEGQTKVKDRVASRTIRNLEAQVRRRQRQLELRDRAIAELRAQLKDAHAELELHTAAEDPESQQSQGAA
jgi:hypothetical protein